MSSLTKLATGTGVLVTVAAIIGIVVGSRPMTRAYPQLGVSLPCRQKPRIARRAVIRPTRS